MLTLLLIAMKTFSQSGGPPILTTDPGTPENNHWEINTAIGFHFPSQSTIQLPSVEVVYGIGGRFQISTQLPLPEIELSKTHYTVFTQPQMGVKYRFMDEEKNFISCSIYPQVIIPLNKEQKTQIFVPLQLEKSFNSFRVGQELGYFVLNNPNGFFSGTLAGYRLKNDVELMAEFFCSGNLDKSRSVSGLLNFGFRKRLSKNIVLMSSIGTEVITPEGEDHEPLFGLIGTQILLGD